MLNSFSLNSEGSSWRIIGLLRLSSRRFLSVDTNRRLGGFKVDSWVHQGQPFTSGTHRYFEETNLTSSTTRKLFGVLTTETTGKRKMLHWFSSYMAVQNILSNEKEPATFAIACVHYYKYLKRKNIVSKEIRNF